MTLIVTEIKISFHFDNQDFNLFQLAHQTSISILITSPRETLLNVVTTRNLIKANLRGFLKLIFSMSNFRKSDTIQNHLYHNKAASFSCGAFSFCKNTINVSIIP